MALDPGRDVDEQREARGMALGKTVFAEAFDLLETILDELSRIATLAHAFDKTLPEKPDLSGALEGRHRAAQLAGLRRGEPGGDHGDLHRLLLKQWHAQGPSENVLQFIGIAKSGIG